MREIGTLSRKGKNNKAFVICESIRVKKSNIAFFDNQLLVLLKKKRKKEKQYRWMATAKDCPYYMYILKII